MKFKLLFFTLLFFCFSHQALAVTPTASPSASPITEDASKIKELKEKVADKVNELRKNKRMVYYGEILGVKSDTFTMMTSDGEKTIETLKDTGFFWITTQGKKLNLSFSNLEKGDFVTVEAEVGDGTKIIAKNIVGKNQTFYLQGNVNKVLADGAGLTLSFRTKDTLMSITVNNTTKILNLSENYLLESAKLKDIKTDQKIIILGSYSDSTKEKILGQKIIIYERPVNAKSPTPTEKVKSSN